MSDEQDFIVPPPGLLPDVPESELDDGHARHERVQPVFAPGTTAPKVPGHLPMPPVTTPPANLQIDDTVRADPQSSITTAATPVVDETTARSSGSSAPTTNDDEVGVNDPWCITGSGGFKLIVDGHYVLGRDPDSTEGGSGARAIAVDDPARSVSKTHALITLADDGTVRLTDLASTNGSRVWPEDGELTPLVAGEAVAVPDHATILLGDFGLRLDRSASGTV